MLQVGDSATHAAFLSALTSSHGYNVIVESYFEGEKIGEVSVEGGTVQVTADARERRRIDDLTAPERYWPTVSDSVLSPQGIWVRALVQITSGTRVFPAVPVFAGKLLRTRRINRSGHVVCVAADPMWQVNRESFEIPRAAPAGTGIVALVSQLLLEVFPAATLEDRVGGSATVPTSGLVWDAAAGSRGMAIDELATSVGAEVFARPTRVWPAADFVIRPVPRLNTGPAVWLLTDGPGGVISQDVRQLDGESVVNRWIGTVEPTSGSGTLYASATDVSITSATRYGGPMGKLVDFYSSPLVSSVAQLQIALQAKLARSIGMADGRALRVIVNPALEGGDLLQVSMGTEAAVRHIADSFDVPLSVASASMDIQTRSAVAG